MDAIAGVYSVVPEVFSIRVDGKMEWPTRSHSKELPGGLDQCSGSWLRNHEPARKKFGKLFILHESLEQPL